MKPTQRQQGTTQKKLEQIAKRPPTHADMVCLTEEERDNLVLDVLQLKGDAESWRIEAEMAYDKGVAHEQRYGEHAQYDEAARAFLEALPLSLVADVFGGLNIDVGEVTP